MANKRLIYRLVIYLNISTILCMALGFLWYKAWGWGLGLLALGGATLWVYLGIRLATRATTLKIARAQRLENYTHQLFALSKSEAVQAGDCDGSLALFSEVIANTLGISRVSFWTYIAEEKKLQCLSEYTQGEFRLDSTLEILEATTPVYLQAIQQEKIIAAANAKLHPLTKEFGDYFQQHNIAALLDVPYYLDSRLAGIICCEHALAKSGRSKRCFS
ncbi:MAG: GAF domain-containing protein [Saprospiraceae bacterium]|nr:GAF domain-containing protein [Saprospiraceae bacterium]